VAVVNSQERPESFFFCVVHGGERMRRGGGYGETLGKGKRVRSFWVDEIEHQLR
jgi:hypothetical protein